MKHCKIQTSRRGGPGGQHRNKVETAVIWLHQPSGIQAEASEKRSQAANREVAFQRLRVKLAVQVRSPEELDRSPSSLLKSRVVSGRLQISASHRDFPAILAEVLDFLAESDFSSPDAATRIGASASQITKLLKLETAALDWVNEQRIARNLTPLR